MKKLKYLFLIILVLFMSVPSVNALVINSSFLGQDVGTTYGIASNSYKQANSSITVDQINALNYFVVDICITSNFSISNISNYSGSVSHYQTINSLGSCNTGNYSGSLSRIYFKVNEWADAGNGNYGLIFSSRFNNTSNYYSETKILNIYTSNEINNTNELINNQTNELNNSINNSTNTITGSIDNAESNINSSIQSSEDNINQNIDDMEQSIVDSNKETQDVIKDQFNDCHDSSNLFNVTDYRNLNFNTNAGATFTLTSDSAIVVSASGSNSSGVYLTNSSVTQYVDNFNTNDYYYVSADISSDEAFQLQFGGKTRQIFNISSGVTRVKVYTNFVDLGLVFYARSSDNTFTIKNIQFSLYDVSYEPYGEEICTNKIDETNQELNDLNNNLTDDNVDGVQGAFEGFESFISENSTITQLITMPITLYSSILNGLQSTCQPFVLGNLFGTNLTIPCINIGNYLGSTLWTMIDIIISGFAVWSISAKFIKVFNNFSTMKEGDVIDD